MSTNDLNKRFEQIAQALGLKANQIPESWADPRPLVADLPPAPVFNPWHSPNSVDKYFCQNLNGRNANAKSQIHS